MTEETASLEEQLPTEEDIKFDGNYVYDSPENAPEDFLPLEVRCGDCGGTGFKETKTGRKTRCKACSGSGWILTEDGEAVLLEADYLLEFFGRHYKRSKQKSKKAG